MNKAHNCANPIVVLDERHRGFNTEKRHQVWRGRCLECGYEGWFSKANSDDAEFHRDGEDPTYRRVKEVTP